MLYNFNDLLDSCKNSSNKIVALAGGDDYDAVKALEEANEYFSLSAILIGNKNKIQEVIKDSKLNNYEICEVATGMETSKAISLINDNKADILMKGNISSSNILKAVLAKENDFRLQGLISHVSVFEIPRREKLIILTDGGMNIAPTLKEKVEIINNALVVAQALEIPNPKVAILAAVETVSDNMTATIDAAILTQMNRRGQIKGCIIDGPLALDGAISKEAATHKGITSEVAGEADILLVPDIEAGNILGKSISYLAGGIMAGVILGATRPVVLPSRSDPARAKLASIALATKLSPQLRSK